MERGRLWKFMVSVIKQMKKPINPTINEERCKISVKFMKNSHRLEMYRSFLQSKGLQYDQLNIKDCVYIYVHFMPRSSKYTEVIIWLKRHSLVYTIK